MSCVSDVNEVFSRLFDHRPFLKGEIEFFKKEFEVSFCILHRDMMNVLFVAHMLLTI